MPLCGTVQQGRGGLGSLTASMSYTRIGDHTVTTYQGPTRIGLLGQAGIHCEQKGVQVLIITMITVYKL
jgi:hypothetical protein